MSNSFKVPKPTPIGKDMAQRISEGKFNLDLYKNTIVKALHLENSLKDTIAKEGLSYRVENLVRFYLEASSISSIQMLGSEYTDKALLGAFDWVSNFAEKLADADHFERIAPIILKPLKTKALDRLEASPILAEKYYDICLKLAKHYKSAPDAAAAFKEAALFANKANFSLSKAAKGNPRSEAYSVLFESGNYLSAADWAREAGLDDSKVLAAATEAYNIKFKSEYPYDLEKCLDIAKEYNLGSQKVEAIGKKICQNLESIASEKEAHDASLAGYYQSQIAFYANKAGLLDLAKSAAIKASQLKFKAAENAKEDTNLQRSAYLFILDVAKTYGLDEQTSVLAHEKLKKLQSEMDAKEIERENSNKAAVDLLFSTWFETKRG